MSLTTPGASTLFPGGQVRQQYGRDWGNYTTVAGMPNGSGNVLSAAQFKLEPGDRCYLSLSGGECEYLCVSAGTATSGNAVWVPSSGQGPWSSVLYVDQVRGSDTTGQRGNANRPFATLQAAANAMVTDDFMLVGPQRFLTTVALTFPATLVRGGMNGFSRGGGVNTSSAAGLGAILRCTGDHAINLGTNLGLTRFYMSNMQVSAITTAGKFGVFADGSAYAVGTFLSSGLIIENCDVRGPGGGVSTKYAVTQTYFSLQSFDICSFVNFFSLSFYACTLATSAITISSDVNDPLTLQQQPTCGIFRASVLGGGSVAGVVSWGGQVFINAEPSVTIGGLVGSGLSAHAAAPVANPGCRFAARIAGSNAGIVDFATAGRELPDTATALIFDFRQTRFAMDNNNCTVKFKVGGAAGNFQTVSLDGATFTPPGSTIIADAKIHISMRGASVPQGIYQTPGADGDIIPPSICGTIDISAGGAVAKTWVNLGYAGFVRSGAAPDVALATPNARASDTVITVKATTGLTFDSAATAGNNACNWEAIWK